MEEFSVSCKKVLDQMPSNVLADNTVVPDIVAEILMQSSDLARKRSDDLFEYEQMLTELIDYYVEENYQSLNGSITSFSDVLRHLQEERDVLKMIEGDNTIAIESLETHARDIREIFVQQTKLGTTVKIMEDIHRCTELVHEVEKALAEKQYAVAGQSLLELEKGLDKPFGTARCMTALRLQYVSYHRKLFETMTTQLADTLFSTSTAGSSDDKRGARIKQQVETIVKILNGLGKLQEAQSILFAQFNKRTEMLIESVTIEYSNGKRSVVSGDAADAVQGSMGKQFLSIQDPTEFGWSVAKFQGPDVAAYLTKVLTHVYRFLKNFKVYAQEVVKCEFPWYSAKEEEWNLQKLVLDAACLREIEDHLADETPTREGSVSAILISKVMPVITSGLSDQAPLHFTDLMKQTKEHIVEICSPGSTRMRSSNEDQKEVVELVQNAIKSVLRKKLNDVVSQRMSSMNTTVPLTIVIVHIERIIAILTKTESKKGAAAANVGYVLPVEPAELIAEFRSPTWISADPLETLLSQKGKSGLPKFIEEIPVLPFNFLTSNATTMSDSGSGLKVVTEHLSRIFFLCVMNIITIFRPVMGFVGSLSSLVVGENEIDPLVEGLRNTMQNIAVDKFGPEMVSFMTTKFNKVLDPVFSYVLDVRPTGPNEPLVLRCCIELQSVCDSMLAIATNVPSCNTLIYNTIASMIEKNNSFWLTWLQRDQFYAKGPHTAFCGRIVMPLVGDLMKSHTSKQFELLQRNPFGPIMTAELCQYLKPATQDQNTIIPCLSTFTGVLHICHSFEWLGQKLFAMMRRGPVTEEEDDETRIEALDPMITKFPGESARLLDEAEASMWCTSRCYDLWRNTISVSRIAFLLVSLDIRAATALYFVNPLAPKIQLADLQNEVYRMYQMTHTHLGPKKSTFLFGSLPGMCLQQLLRRVNMKTEALRAQSLTSLRRDLASLAHAFPPMFPKEVRPEIVSGLHMTIQLIDALVQSDSSTVPFPVLGEAYNEVDFSYLAG